MDLPAAVRSSSSTPVSNSTLLPLLLFSLATQKYTPQLTNSFNEEYDYIVVGGGAAGSVIASRLSEESRVNVLLLEAGQEPPILTEVPALERYFAGPDVDWQFKTVPQQHAASSFKNRELKIRYGKMLGGSGSVNGMAYVRGNRKDYDDWARNGAEGWSYDEIFHYFLKLEDNRSPAFVANGYHAVGGPITVEQPKYYPELKKAMYDSARSLGYEFVDPNGAEQTGFYDLQANMKNNQRCSTVKGYLVPAENRTNLHISLNSYVTKVIIEGGKATGVIFSDKDGGFRTVKARKEIILSAGAINSPKILMLSGIGPREELEKWNIPVVSNLPVGKNLHDHGGTHMFFTMNPIFRGIEEKVSNNRNILQYIHFRSGPLASTDNLIIAFMNGLNAARRTEVPNYEIYVSELPSSDPKGYGLRPEVYERFFGPYEGRAIFRCSISQLKPKSRGRLTLNSSNPFASPLIDENYLQDPSDLEPILEGIKMCRQILNSRPLRRLGAKLFETLISDCAEYAGREDEYWSCYARSFLFSFDHTVGSVKMGDPQDPSTVVDPQLRVKNIQGLRVADASVMPSVPRGNIYIPVIMVAEKASDMIKASMDFQWQ